MAQERIAFLQSVPLLAGLDRKQMQRLANRFVERSYKAGDAIVRQGRGGEGLFVIVSGRAEARRETADGSSVVVSSFGPKDFFGEIALLSPGVRTASVVALDDVDCLVLTRSDLIAVMKADADMGVVIAQAVAQRLRQALDTLTARM